MNLIDTHSHLFLEEFDPDFEQVIERAKASGISKIFMPNIDCSTVGPMLKVASACKGYCIPMIGLHPTSVNDTYEGELKKLKCILDNNPGMFSAIGEIGMDLYWDKTYIEEQKIVFERQIRWSLDNDLPLVIHSRNSFDEIYTILRKYFQEPISGIFHSFTGSLEDAERIMEFDGFMLGINGVVTFKKSTLPQVLKQIPLDRIVLETDSPYLTPAPFRGKRNESAYLSFILTKLSEIYGVPEEIVSRTTTQNALKVFKMGEYPAVSL